MFAFLSAHERLNKLWSVLAFVLLMAGQAATGKEAGDGEPKTTPPVRLTPPPTRCWRPYQAVPQPDTRRATGRYEPTFVASEADRKIIATLEKPLPEGGLKLHDGATLDDFRAWVAKSFTIVVRLDPTSLHESDITANTPLKTTRIETGSLWSTVTTVLDDLNMGMLIRDDALVFASKEEVDEYLLLAIYPLPWGSLSTENPQPVIDLIQTVAAGASWDTVGGVGAVRNVPTNVLAIFQTLAAHREVVLLMRAVFDKDLAPTPLLRADRTPLRVHRLTDSSLASEIQSDFVTTCNEALGAAGDPNAKVTIIGNDRLVVQSAGRPFHVYAAELIYSMDGSRKTSDVVRYQPQPDAWRSIRGFRPVFAVSPGDAEVIAALTKPLPKHGLRLEADANLDDLRAWLTETFKIPVFIDHQSLKAADMSVNPTINESRVENGHLWTTLMAVLGPLEIGYVVQNEALILTTAEGARDQRIWGMHYLPPHTDDFQGIIELIQSTVGAETWEATTGPGPLRPFDQERAFFVLQTLPVHMEIASLMHTLHDTNPDGAGEPSAGSHMVNIHHLTDPSIANALIENLVSLCNAGLGKAGDLQAKVTLIGRNCIRVQSSSKPFLAYSTELIRALDGIEDDLTADERERFKHGFCWVAREVYGKNNPRWLLFRRWMLDEAPEWLRCTYITHGEAFSLWLHDRPVAKATLRPLMDRLINTR